MTDNENNTRDDEFPLGQVNNADALLLTSSPSPPPPVTWNNADGSVSGGQGGGSGGTADPVQRQMGQQQFVEEIDYNEIETEEVIGKGSFGVVWKGKWRGRYVAVKHIDTEGERRAFAIEVRQLSRVAHPNIVRLYGACTRNPVCLVMEYAEGGSLYNVLHCEPQPRYTAAHAMSWALQCACGVAYLHNMKPKPLIHRDLKPPNLLLVFGGRTLKICDFGTACDLNTYMTNNKGSAAWMAPEVFEGSRYTEKCDVFSWGVILWEVLSRRKPFDDIGGSAYRIMWAVHIGQRPPLMEGCPRPIEHLIVQCWRKIPEERPSMNEVVRVMTHLSEFFVGHEQPLDYSSLSTTTTSSSSSSSTTISTSLSSSSSSSANSNIDVEAANACRMNNKDRSNDEQSSILTITSDARSISSIGSPPTPPLLPPPVYQPVDGGLISTGCDATTTTTTNVVTSPLVHFQPLHVHCDPDAWEFSHSSDSSWEIRNMAGLDKMLPKNNKKTLQHSSDNCEHELDTVYRLLDVELRPLTPDHTSQLSQDIFQQHKQLAQEYLKVQTEIALVGQHKTEILKSLSSDTLRQQLQLQKLQDEKESLVKLYRNLKRQLEIMKGRQARLVPATNNNIIQHDSTSQIAPQSVTTATSTAPTADNGWVVVPRQELTRIL